jgi:WD40 repeat protein
VLATADRQGGMYLWQAKNGRTVEQLKGHEGAIYALKYTPDSKYLVSSGHDGTVQQWDTWTYQRVRTFKAHNAPVTNVDVAPDGTIVTTSNDHTTKAWKFDGTAIRDYAGLTDWGYQARFRQGRAGGPRRRLDGRHAFSGRPIAASC